MIYPGNDLAKVIYENEQKFFYNAEIPIVGAPSIAYQLRRERGASYPFGASVEITFATDPGTFDMAVQIADSDKTGSYVTIGDITSTNTTFTGRFDITNLFPKYVRLLPITLTNAVAAISLLTR